MKLWGGRFTEKSNEKAGAFNASVSFDKRLYRYDIQGSIAHAAMLGAQGIIPLSDSEAIVAALNNILADIDSGVLAVDEKSEDIHSFVEAELIGRIGSAGRRLHTGRSRNDQVALDMRLYVMDKIDGIRVQLLNVLEVILSTAKTHAAAIMPGFTHMQKAQPVTLGAHMLAYFQMLKRDYGRLSDCYQRTDVMPLGSGALAGTAYPIDREFVKDKLGFHSITENSLDAVSDRDFCAEFVFCLSLVMTHLSRFCEELILWSTEEFGFIEISDAFSTGSSIMPQKKNPDIAELIRGKTGRVYGSLMGILTVLKGLPLAYNKDMQEDKEAVFDAADTVYACLSVFGGMLGSAVFCTDKLYKSAQGGYTNATDAADWLVSKGIPFRDAHEIVGRLVLYAIDRKKRLDELTPGELKEISDIFDKTFYEAVAVETCVRVRNLAGGKEIKSAERFLKECRKQCV